MTDWQPIETAPKDGRTLILSDGKSVFPGFWHDPDEFDSAMGAAFETEPGWYHVSEVEDWQKRESGPSTATHWMPLPEPPGA